MNLVLAMLMLGGQAAVPPPPGLLFGFYRMVAFEQRAKELGCGAHDLDREFEAIRRQLARRYGKKPFSRPKIPPGGVGDCYSAVSVYRVNLADFRRDAAAALAAAPGAAAPAP